MPEILKHPNGQPNWVAIFSALAASLVLVLQQWQTYKIAELKQEAEIAKVQYMSKDDIQDHLSRLENNFIAKDLLMSRFGDIERRLNELEAKTRGN